MDFKINTTHRYHQEELNTLGWELTVCNSLYPENTVLRSILKHNKSFGRLLYEFLSRYIPMDRIDKIIEIGGGYGYLMKDFLHMDNTLKITMVDISPFLLKRQKETLKDYKLTYIEKDFLQIEEGFLEGFHLAIMNENLGDFPTVVDLKKDFLKLSPLDITDPCLRKVKELFDKYNLLPSEGYTFNFNIGALEGIEKLCMAGIPYIYAGEHSCEASPPDFLKPFININSTGNPERISLKGHDEYTIKFSHLKKVGEAFGYKMIRGCFADFIPIRFDERIKKILATQGRDDDVAEMICYFVEDLFKYEFLIFVKNC